MEKSFMSIKNTYQGSSVGSQDENEKTLFRRCQSHGTLAVAGCNFKTIKNRSNDLFFGLQTAGGVLLGVSGYLDGNMGRLTTGIANSTRNTIWFPLKKYMPSEDVALTVASTLAVGTNVPQFMSSASIYEMIAASLVISAYSMKAVPGFSSLGVKAYNKITGKKPAKENPFLSAVVRVADSEVMGVEEKSLSTQVTDKFKGVAVQGMQYGPPVLLAGRAVMQIADGVVRQDYSAAGAGVAYLTGSVVWFIGACKLSGKKKAPSSKKTRDPYPWETQQA